MVPSIRGCQWPLLDTAKEIHVYPLIRLQMAVLEHDKKQLSLERQQLKRKVQSLQVCSAREYWQLPLQVRSPHHMHSNISAVQLHLCPAVASSHGYAHLSQPMC